MVFHRPSATGATIKRLGNKDEPQSSPSGTGIHGLSPKHIKGIINFNASLALYIFVLIASILTLLSLNFFPELFLLLYVFVLISFYTAFREVFDLFDGNGGGTIDAEELDETLRSVDICLESHQIAEVMLSIDHDGMLYV